MTSRRTTRPTRLRRFAAAHHLRVTTFREIDCEDRKIVERQIQFDDRAIITDLLDDDEARESIGGRSRYAKFLKEYQAGRQLVLTIWREHDNYLFEAIGFDVPSYANPSDPRKNAWAKRLARVGIEYLEGDDNSISFTFPIHSARAVKTVLALVAAKVSLEDLPAKVRAPEPSKR